jgi:hypothetical protein
MKKAMTLCCIMAGLFVAGQTLACGIEGTAVNSDGLKINGTGTISTSWNSEKAFPRSGYYSLDLGSSVCGERITVYLDGNDGKMVTVRGMTRVDFVRR